MENEEINKIILQKENENNIIYTILNENLKNNDKLTNFIKDNFRKCNFFIIDIKYKFIAKLRDNLIISMT